MEQVLHLEDRSDPTLPSRSSFLSTEGEKTLRNYMIGGKWLPKSEHQEL